MSNYQFEIDCQPGFDRLIDNATGSKVLIKRLGCEVIGYDIYDSENKKTLPLLWNNGNDGLPFEGAWKNHATILFPIVGGLKNDKSVTTDGVTIALKGNHGFARSSVFELKTADAIDSASATYFLSTSAERMKAYPYPFGLELTYTLKEGKLTLSFKITNPATKPMHCQFGWHPGFSTNLGLNGKRADWTVSLPDGDYKQFGVLPSGDSYLTGNNPVHSFKGPIPFTDHELYCTLMYDIPVIANRRIRLYNAKLKRGVEMLFSDFPQIGLWANEGQEYICLEPWQGVDDHEEQEPFNKKVGILTLEPGQTVVRSATIIPVMG